LRTLRINLSAIASKKKENAKYAMVYTLRTQKEKPMKHSEHCVLTSAPLRQKKENAKDAMVDYAKNARRKVNET